jgi:hypothetical protein
VAKHEARKFATTKTTTNVAKTQSGVFGTTKTTTNVAKHDEVVNLEQQQQQQEWQNT